MPENKKNKTTSFYLIALMVTMVGALFFYFNIDLFLSDYTQDYSTAGQPIKQFNQETLSGLKELKQCGDWPLVSVNLSADRGNPFARKDSPLPVTAAVATPECLPVLRIPSQ